jgi:fido (protein-threonine AMPylation protein)
MRVANIKERNVKGKTYLYVYSSASYKGEKKIFEKSIGPKNSDKKELEERKEFYSAIVDVKKEMYLTYLETRNMKFQYLQKGYAFPLVFIKRQYHDFLSNLYPSDLEKYKEEFEVRYVHNTTAIEGNTLSLKETALVLDRGLAPKTKELREIHEVENYKRLRTYINVYKGDINIKFICKLHKFIQRNIDDDGAGCIRRIPVGITGSKWEPPPAIVVEEELNNLLDWYEENKKSMHPVELAGLFHHKYLQIHPFKDGNGRVARELLNFILEKRDYPPIVIPVKLRQEYMEFLEEADNDNIIPLLEFLSIYIIEDYVKIVGTITDRVFQLLNDITDELRDERRHEILELFIWSAMLFKDHLEITPPEIGMKYTEMIGIDKNPNVKDFLEKISQYLSPSN